MALQHQWNTSSKQWEIKLADNSIVSGGSPPHLLNPYVFGNWLFFVRVGFTNKFIARKISTGVEFSLIPNDQIGCRFVAAYDGSRYVTIAMRANQGKYSEVQEVLAAVFDTTGEAWLNFSAQPELSQYHPIANPGVPTVLWIHNGHQVQGFDSGDPGTRVRRVTLLSPTSVEFVTMETNTIGQATSYILFQRDFTIPAGVLGPIVQMNSHTQNPNAATEPVWLV